MNNFIPKKCKTCRYLSIDFEENKYTCNNHYEYLTKKLADKCNNESEEV